MSRKAAALIPARLESTRLARKMLLAESGLPLVVHTARNVLASNLFARVVVATDAVEIQRALTEHGVESVNTRADHQSGTSRIGEAAFKLGLGNLDVLVNVQGDEPELDHGSLTRLLGAFADPNVSIATLATPIQTDETWTSPSVVKVVCDARGNALYFSRAPIPCRAAHGQPAAGGPGGAFGLRHLGVYAFVPRVLEQCCALPPGRLELLENLEQLRWLEAGLAVRVLEAEQVSLGIDTRQDYDAFVRRALGRDR